MSAENYLRVLRESLEKKIELLNKIIVRNEQQRQIFQSEELVSDALDENMEAKSRLVDQIVAIDDGFDQLFKSVEQQLNEDRQRYQDEIRTMQGLIRQITELSAKVESQERRNRDLAVNYFSRAKADVKKKRVSSTAATQYYQNMMHAGAVDPLFMDSKK